MARLVRNVPGLMHSAQMPRLAGTDGSLGGIYVLPWSLADICPRRNVTEVVWPENGALAYPLWLTVQAKHRERLAPLIDHFYGGELGRYLNGNRYPALGSGGAALPPGARLSWLGWDYVRHAATAADIKRACGRLRRCAGRARPCGGVPMRVITVAGPPSVGKTAVIVRTAKHLATQGLAGGRRQIRFAHHLRRRDLCPRRPAGGGGAGGQCLPRPFLRQQYR